MATVKETQRQASTERMLEAALNLFAREGYTRSSMSRIAEKAGMVKGSLSIRFGTKEKLYNAVQRLMWERSQEAAETESSTDEFLRSELNFLRREEEAGSDLYLFIQNFLRGIDLPPNATEYANSIFAGSRMEEMITRCIQEGRLPPDSPGEAFIKLNRFAIGTFWNYRTCGMKLPSDDIILNGLWDQPAPRSGKSGNTDETLKEIGVKAILNDYDIIFYVEVKIDPKEDLVHLLRLNPAFEELCPQLRTERFAHRFYVYLNENLIPEEDQEAFMKTLVRKPVLKVLTAEGKMSFQFRLRNKDKIRHYQMVLNVDMARDGSLRGYTAGIRNCDEHFALTAQAANSRRIIEVLAQRYTSLYHVNATTGMMTSYAANPQFNNAFIKSSDIFTEYDDAVRKFCAAYFTEGQNQETFDDCKLENVILRLEREMTFERFFRFTDGWQSHYGRVQFFRTGTPGTFDYGFVAALDLEDDRVLRHYINRSLEEEYVSIYFIDLKREIVRCYKQSDVTSTGRFSTVPLAKVATAFAKEVKPAYRDQFEAFADPQKIIDFIGVEERRELTYELRGNVGSWRRSLWQIAEWNEGHPTGVLVTFMSIDDESVRRMRLDIDISGTLSGRYDNILCVDLDEDRFIHSRMDEKSFAFLGRVPEDGIRYTELTELYSKHYVHENDRKRFIEISSPEYLKEALTRRKHLNITFLSNYTGEYRYREMSVTRMPDEQGHTRFILAFVDADDWVRFEMKRTEELQRKNIALNRISEDIIDLMGILTEARDVQSGEHIRRVKGYTHILAQQVMNDWPEFGLTQEKINLMTSASALHDVGKIMIPDAILLKKAPLDADERKIMETHCERGAEILSKAPMGWSEDYVKMSMDICMYHHEKYDGNGYPYGLKGEEIPVSAQIVSIADCFDALTTERVYKDPYAMEEACRMITDGECGIFSEKMLQSFGKCREAFFHHAITSKSSYSSGALITGNDGLFAGMRFLYVEENPINLNIGTDLLHGEGAETVTTSTGEEAVRVFREMAPGTFSAVLINLQLPGMNGMETAKMLRDSGTQDAQNIPVIGLVPQPTDEAVHACYDAGMNGYLTKPMSVEKLNKVILESMENASAT